MKRQKKKISTKPGVAVTARVIVHAVPSKPEEVLKRFNAYALADALYDQAIKSGEPVSPSLKRHVAEQHGAAAKLLDAVPVVQGAKRRTAGLQSKNEKRQREAERDYQKYRDIAGALIDGNPQLRGATRYRLAKKVQAELAKQGRGVVSARTIWEALRPKNKV